MEGNSQNLTIRLNASGRNVIPYISPQSIVTIHGKNGIGKSMAATLLEIASGNYIFQNEAKFKKLTNIIESCEIVFENNGKVLFKLNLTPYSWVFDESLNRVNPLTLGDFYEIKDGSERKISFDQFKENVHVRTIRGNESLKQQILFFKEVFVAKINQKIKNLEKKIDFLSEYQNWLAEHMVKDTIDNYQKLQEEYNDQLNIIGNLETSNFNRKAKIKKLDNQLDLIQKLIFVLENDVNVLNSKKKDEEVKLKQIRDKNDANHKKLVEYERNLEELKNQFDSKTKKILKKLEKARKEKEKLEQKLDPEFHSTVENILETESQIKTKKIEANIKKYQEKVSGCKTTIEELNKENERIIEINKFLTQLRDICSKASSSDFCQEKLIRVNEGEGIDQLFSFEELYNIFDQNNIIFKEDQELKEYQNEVKSLNEKILKNKKTLQHLEDYSKIQKKISKFEEQLKGKSSSKLDDYVDLETKILHLENKQKEKRQDIRKIEQEISECEKNVTEIKNLIEKVRENPSETLLTSNLSKLDFKIEQQNIKPEKLKKQLGSIEQEIEKNKEELKLMERQEQEMKNEVEKSIKNLEPLSKKIHEAAKKFGFSEKGEFIDYFKKHDEKSKKYIANTTKLHTRLSILKDDIEKVIEGEKSKNKVHLDIINHQFDKIFKEIYGKKEFFDYVFKDYSRILNFDIANKTILFETIGGLKETRDLDEFSSGEKTYAYCRSIISMTADMAKYNIVILDESYALLDIEHSQNLYQFQKEMIQNGHITKFVNLLPFKENLDALSKIVQRNLEQERTKEDDSNIEYLDSQLNIIRDFNNQISEQGYYQEIHFPKNERKELSTNLGNVSVFNPTDSSGNLQDYREILDLDKDEFVEEGDLDFSFILDGSNIAYSNQISGKPSIRNVIKCMKKLQKMGIPEKNILIIFGSGVRHKLPLGEINQYEDLIRKQTIQQAPAGRDDDWFIINFALENNSYIITNDGYYDYREKYPQNTAFIDSHSIRYNILINSINFDEGFNEKLKEIKPNMKKS